MTASARILPFRAPPPRRRPDIEARLARVERLLSAARAEAGLRPAPAAGKCNTGRAPASGLAAGRAAALPDLETKA